MTKYQKICVGAVVALILCVVLAFFVTSLCLASEHGLTVVQEWRNWFGIVEDASEGVTAGISAFVNFIA